MKNLIKLFATAFLFLVISFSSNAQTYISGFISANTTWHLTGSPFIVTGNTLLSHGYTLTIEPGVIVKFDTNRVLQIDGELIAIGTPPRRITFTSLQASPKAGDWGKIHFADTCVNAVFDSAGHYLSGCIMKYCDVLYGGGIGFGEIHVAGSSPYISECKILSSSTAGIYCEKSSCVLDSSAIKNCLGDGLHLTFFFINKCGLTIRTDTIEGNTLNGIYLGWTGFYLFNLCPNHGIYINNNSIISNQGGAVYSYQWIDSLFISENYFYGNNGGFYAPLEQTKNSVIECNTFINNYSGNGGLIYFANDSDIIRNNLFDGNSASSSSSIIAIVGGVYRVNNNIFKNNIITGNSVCSFSSASSPTPICAVDHNSFINNTALSAIKIIGGGSMGNSLNFVKYNNFLDPNSTYELYNTVPYGGPDVRVDSNYWGTTNTQHIDSAIYDFFDYGNLSVVFYQSPLSSPAVVDTSCSFLSIGIPVISDVIYSTPFPNPFSSYSTITFKEELKDASLLIYNIFGQKVKAMEHINANSIRVDRANMVSGIYIYEVVEKQRRIANGKLVVE